MHPILFEIPLPEFLHGSMGTSLPVYSYGFFIALGAMTGSAYTANFLKKQHGFKYDKTVDLLLWILGAAVVGGKLFFYFEDPAYYFSNPSHLTENFGNGFVFYGSLLFTIPTMIWWFLKNKLPLWPMFDVMSVTACLVHLFGRMGCFMAGCCHGIPWDGPWAVAFTDPKCLAEPLNTPLHPTQLYGVALNLTILIVLFITKKRQRFHGQLALTYLTLYAVGRSVIEFFRGDAERGYVIDGYLTHSQAIALFLIGLVFYLYLKLRHTQAITSKP